MNLSWGSLRLSTSFEEWMFVKSEVGDSISSDVGVPVAKRDRTSMNPHGSRHVDTILLTNVYEKIPSGNSSMLP